MDKDTKKWLGVIFGFIGLMAVFNGLLLSAALSDRKSLEAIPGAYDQGLKWDQTRVALDASEQLAWTAALSVGPGNVPGSWRLEVTLQDAQAQPVTLDQALVQLERPSDLHAGTSLTLVQSAPGRYAGEVALSGYGKWYATLRLDRGSERYLRRHEVFVPAPASEPTGQTP